MKLEKKFSNIYLLINVCVLKHKYQGACMKVRGQIVGVNSLFPSWGYGDQIQVVRLGN